MTRQPEDQQDLSEDGDRGRSRRRWPRLLAILGALAVGSAAVTWLLAPNPDQLADEWVLVDGHLVGQPIDQVGYQPITFTASNGSFGGHDGCNTFFSSGMVLAGWVWANPFGEYFSTLAGCPDGPIGDTADRYRSAVTRWARWARVTPSGELVLWGPATTLRFAPRQPGVNVDQLWTLQSATVGDTTFAAGPDTGVPDIWLHIPLDPDQPIEGFNGCNHWTAPADTLTVGRNVTIGQHLDRSDSDCTEIAGADAVATIAPVDDLVFAALEQVSRAERDGDRLVLSGSSVELAYRLDR